MNTLLCIGLGYTAQALARRLPPDAWRIRGTSRDPQLEPEAVHAWSGDAFSAYWELYSDGSSPIDYRVPDEGGVVWIDTACITDEAKAPNAAHAFINFTLNAQVNAEITNYVYYATPNAAAKEYVDEAALENESIYPSEETMQNLEFIRNLGQATTMWSEAWTEVQNA